ncbi:hypothetical protein YC2023_118420 [Brassica napus]
MVFVNLQRNGCLLHFGRAKNRDCKLDFMTYRIIAKAFVVTGNLYERQWRADFSEYVDSTTLELTALGFSWSTRAAMNRFGEDDDYLYYREVLAIILQISFFLDIHKMEDDVLWVNHYLFIGGFTT